MMAETEVSKVVSKVVGIEEKCGLDMSSYQDLPKPDCNGTNHHNKVNDLDNSYVFVTGADGHPDDAIDNKDVVAEGSSVSPISKAVAIEDQGAKLDSQNEKLDAVSVEVSEPLNEGGNGNVERSNGDPPVVTDRIWKHESSLDYGKAVQVSVADSLEEHTGKTESSAEAEVKQVEDPDRKIESLAEAAVEKVGDENGKIEGAAEGEQEKLDELTKSASPPGPVENQESQIGALGLVAESGENEEVNNISSHTNSSGTANDECGNQINISVIETSEACQGSQGVVVDIVECGLQDVSVEAEDEVKLAREVVETAEPDSALGLVAESGENEEVNNISSHTNSSANANDECGNQINLSVVETLEACQESQGVVVDVVECGSQDVSVEAEDGVKLAREVVETAEPDSALGLVAESGENEEVNNISSHTNCSANANDECGNQINLSVVETLEACQESQGVVVDVVECGLQDVSLEAEDEVKLEREVVETAEHEVPPSTSLDLDLELNPINSKDETLKEEAETTLSFDVVEDQQCDTALGNNVQGVLEQIDEANPVVSSTDCHVETVCDLVLEETNKEDFFVSDIDNGVQYPEEPDKNADGSGVSLETLQSETKSEASEPTQSFPASNAHAPQTEIEISDAETIGAVSSSLVGGPNSQIIETGLPGHESWIRCATKEASAGSDSTPDTVVLTEKEPTFQGGEARAETEGSSGKDKVPNNPPATSDVKLEPEVHVHNFSAISSGENSGDVTFACRTEVSDGFNVNKEGEANIELEIEDVEDMENQLDGAAGSSNENLFLQENEDTGNSQSNNIFVASQGDSSANMIDRAEASIKTKTKPFNFLIRIPRFDDESIREQIRLAKLNVDEKTKLRDAIQVQIQEKRANSQIHGIDYEYAKGEGRSARKLVRSKRMEIDSLQSVINKAKNALSIEDIDSQIYNMEHMIQHETLPLKEEKQLIREIKQLKQLREQLSSNMGSQDEIKQALEQREEVEERLKILRKELDILKDSVLKAEAAAVEAEKKYDDENKKVKELQAQFRAADDVRQAAYAQWQSLRKELSKKSKHFFKYKDDAALASNYAFSRDTEALYRLCMNHVENFMELWNTNDEFRREYVRFNARSTVRRLGTLDGRSLGPDEEPPILPSYVHEKVNRMISTPVKVDLASQFPSLELKQETTIENVTKDGKLMKKVTEHKNQEVTNKGPAILVQVNGLDTVSGGDITYEVQEEPKKSRDEIESIKKAEEMRREEAEAKLKEQRRLEALAKANEARERKKRQAEKLQMRAELKTQKEAEQKEKEREKRLRKKERKKAAATDVNDINNCETAPSSESTVEISKDIEVKDMSSVTPKKPQKHWLFTKQSKAKSIPPPLRNRNKKKLQQWMWVGITSLIILVLFWLGNIGVFSNVNLKRRSPIH